MGLSKIAKDAKNVYSRYVDGVVLHIEGSPIMKRLRKNETGRNLICFDPLSAKHYLGWLSLSLFFQEDNC